MNYPFPNCNSDRRLSKIVGAFLVIWIMGLLPAHAQTAKSPYIGNDSLRIIPLKESVLYLTQWNRLELQSTLYGKDYKPVIMHVSGAKYRMDDKEKNVLWMMPDSSSQKVTLRVGKYMKNGVAFKVKDFEFKAVNIKLDIQITVDGKPFQGGQRVRFKSNWVFKVMPDSNMVKQCPETDKYRYWVAEIDISKGLGVDRSFDGKQKLSYEKNSFIFESNIGGNFPHFFDLTIFKTDSNGISTDITKQISVFTRWIPFYAY